ncbi:hypothetical protein SAMN06265795_101352 [Noviherbaspirillum humi]|uniref:Uncharacterized protein n=1 Tax=Noviherbaspirillum humi TaxID=1688639 RepID=A0A239CCR2_9BURK|nr:hypothetical protein [Noviherbaspirillum humi]SNS17244.1 hypothetical protein SAMN06265795_101352 [Noviherbaspirillum humi]
MTRGAQRMLGALLLTAGAAQAQELTTRFSCSASRDDGGERIILADHGEIRIAGERIDALRWESALYRSTHGFDCSIDQDDGLQAEADESNHAWRIRLHDAGKARAARGYDFSRGLNCTIRLRLQGDWLQLQPSCPALCGSRTNFSSLAVNLKTGDCRYDE